MIKILIYLSCLAGSFLTTVAAEGYRLTPQVSTAQGNVQGFTVEFNDQVANTSSKNYVVNQFLGIPYARPPTNDLRFELPFPPEKRSQVFIADKPGNACIQFPANDEYDPWMDTVTVTSEDCLYLNVYVQGEFSASYQSNRNLPVLVWIHGGGFRTGSGTHPLYNATALSALGNIIVVTLNYRLGPLGFLYHGWSHASGKRTANQGLYDQALALDWVYQNIRNFGGDNSRITLAGQSMGSLSVSAHIMTSQRSRNQFNRAILMSGTMLNHGILCRESSAIQTRNMASASGCSRGGDPADWIACLKYTPVSELQQLARSLSINAMVGDDFLPLDPRTALRSGNFRQNVPILTGVTYDELGAELAAKYSKPEVELKDLKEVIRVRLSRGDPLMESIVRSVLLTDKTTFSTLDDFSHCQKDTITRRHLADISSDLWIRCSTNVFGRSVMSANSSGRVWSYLLAQKPTKTMWPICAATDWMGPCHGDDLIYLFGAPLRANQQVFTGPQAAVNNFSEADRLMSRDFIKMVSSFAYTGEVQGDLEWPHYQSLVGAQQVISYHRVLNRLESPKQPIIKNYRHETCVKTWERIQPLC